MELNTVGTLNGVKSTQGATLSDYLTCSSSLLKTVAHLSAPPVKILLVLFGFMSRAKIPGTLAECKPTKKQWDVGYEVQRKWQREVR